MITAIIIDDEKNARDYLEKLIQHYFKQKIQISGTYASVDTGVQAINEYKPDIVFLDIEMPEKNGFDLFKHFDTVNFEVIFTTAHKDYAIDAIQFSALDYLLKPVNFIDLISAIKRFEEKRTTSTQQEQISQILENVCTDDRLYNKVALPINKGYEFVKINSIIYCQSDSNYCKVFCIDGKEYLLAKTLKYVEKLISSDLFIRTHKSYLVNLNYVTKYDKTEDLMISLSNGVQIPVSVRKKEQFLNALLQKK